MNHHPITLERRIQPVAVGRRRREERRERVVVHHHQKQEEHLHDGDDGDNVRDELTVTLAIEVDGGRSEQRQQEHPEHDRPVEPAPVRGDLVEERLHAVGVVRDVPDAEIVGEKRVDDHRGRHRHQRGDEVERADAAFDQTAGAAPRAGDRDAGGITAGDERGE